MQHIAALAFAVFAATPAVADDVPCLGGQAGIFKFVKWNLKFNPPDTTEVTLTVHNNTDHNFKSSEIKFRYGEWHQFFFKLETLAKANSDVTFMNPFGMSQKDAEMLQTITPTLCAIQTIDESGDKKNYD